MTHEQELKIRRHIETMWDAFMKKMPTWFKELDEYQIKMQKAAFLMGLAAGMMVIKWIWDDDNMKDVTTKDIVDVTRLVHQDIINEYNQRKN